MQIGSYSELARQPIYKIRKEQKNDFSQLEKSQIIKIRERIAISTEEHHETVIESNDFYSVSAMKDLLFHVHEHTFTIPEIIKSLNELGLKFCGMDNPRVCEIFEQHFGSSKDLYDLCK